MTLLLTGIIYEYEWVVSTRDTKLKRAHEWTSLTSLLIRENEQLRDENERLKADHTDSEKSLIDSLNDSLGMENALRSANADLENEITMLKRASKETADRHEVTKRAYHDVIEKLREDLERERQIVNEVKQLCRRHFEKEETK